MTTLKLVKQEFFNPNAMRMLLNHNGVSDMIKNQLKKYNKHRVNGDLLRCGRCLRSQVSFGRSQAAKKADFGLVWLID